MTAIVTDAHFRMCVALIRDLAQSGVRVIACEKQGFKDPVGFFSRHVERSVCLPEDGYDDALYSLCRTVFEQTGEKPALFPVGVQTLELLAAQPERFRAVCGFCAATPQQLALLNDKAAVSALAQRLGIAVPQCYDEKNAVLPCVVKPACGEKFGLHAAERYRIVRTRQELEAAIAHFSALTQEAPIVQQYLPGGALGCSVLCSGGKIVCAIAHRRVREYPVSGGPSSCCAVTDSTKLVELVEPIVREMGFSGLAMFEFKLDAQGKARLLEVNPRVWGTYPLTRVSGSNFARCWLALSLGQTPPEFQPPKPVKMVYYPSDFAAAWGYLRSGQPKRALGVLRDWLSPSVKNGLHEHADPKPGRAYYRQLFSRRR